ncbi:hypothetical protein ACOSQ2_017680 [Xanthoceras sorbifolium]
MAREHETTTAAAQQWWGTSEELLLACAVNRHGTKTWDSVAMEVQSRSSTLSSLTPQSCEDKFRDLSRRFGLAAPSQNDAAESDGSSLVPMVDQLRRIRVQELRAEVQRRDVSIVSLEMKVKRLEEERERSVKADADLERETKASEEIVARKSSAAEANSDERDNRSFNESNSTTQKAETTTKMTQNDTVLDMEEKEPRVIPEVETEPVPEEPDRDRDWSSNGKLNETGNVEDDEENEKTTSDWKTGSDNNKNKTSGAGGLSESNELWGESKGEGKEAGLRLAAASKQSSDGQSSAASLSKTIRRRSEVGARAGCSSSEEVSPAKKTVLAVKSEPLVRLLRMIRSHRLGSHFERRLRSQESERYKKLVRQHIDVRTIQSRLDKGLYSNCFQRFYRDLLLLFNNFLVFFRKTSPEYAAAQQLRAQVIKEMTDELRKPEPVAAKRSRASTMVACGKRTSSSVKEMSTENAKEREVEEKVKVKEKPSNIEEQGVEKRRSNERSVSGRRSSRSGSKNSNNNNNKSKKKGGGEVKHEYGNNELSSHDGLDVKLDNKKEISVKNNKKKQGAASFLRRMKQTSPKKVAEKDEDKEDENDDNDDDDDDDNGSDEESKDSRVEELEEMKRRRRGKNNNNSNKNNNNNNNERDVRRERVTRSSSNSKGRGGGGGGGGRGGGGGGGEREESGKSGRKGSGRPPRRSATAAAGERKRGRDNGESEIEVVGSGGKSARKRTRR